MHEENRCGFLSNERLNIFKVQDQTLKDIESLYDVSNLYVYYFFIFFNIIRITIFCSLIILLWYFVEEDMTDKERYEKVDANVLIASPLSQQFMLTHTWFVKVPQTISRPSRHSFC